MIKQSFSFYSYKAKFTCLEKIFQFILNSNSVNERLHEHHVFNYVLIFINLIFDIFVIVKNCVSILDIVKFDLF